MKKFVAGFDPGGWGKFGWCVLALDSWNVVGKGVANYAADAFGKMQQVMNSGQLVAAGIDVPLYWAKKGNYRESDKHVRRHTGASSGTVQGVNSLRGACVIQGFFLAKEIESNYPECVITETHPKALLKLKICSKVGKWSDSAANNEHERDALVSAWAAAQALRGDRQNLFCLDNRNPKDIHVFLKKTVYWWPKTPT